MTLTSNPTIDHTTNTDEFFVAETAPSTVAWCAIIAGAVAAGSVSLALLFLASSLGFATASPWTGINPSVTQITSSAIIGLIVIQWLSSGLGGYLTGRLRNRWTDIESDEVCFRDTTHGFLTWAVATLLTAAFLASAGAAIIDGGQQAVTAIATKGNGSNATVDYYVDSIFRTNGTTATNSGNAEIRAETSRVIINSLGGNMSESDTNYLAQVVANHTGLSAAEAKSRVQTTIVEMKKKLDKARKAASVFSLFTFLSMLIGAFIASIAAALGGRHRDNCDTDIHCCKRV